jgi:phosphomannomutase
VREGARRPRQTAFTLPSHAYNPPPFPFRAKNPNLAPVPSRSSRSPTRWREPAASGPRLTHPTPSLMPHPIRFGTDGWRAVIADGYTFDNVERVARATAQWLRRTQPENPSVLVGYDARFLGAAFAARAAATFASLGFHVRLTDSFVTTPAVSWGTKEYECAAGIAITASHNPPAYNGFKIKSHHGGPADSDMIAEVEAELDRLEEGFTLRPLAELEAEGKVEYVGLQSAYTYLLGDRIDTDAIRKAGLKIGVDPMFGAGQGVVPDLLGRGNVVEINSEFNPGMRGRAPEPIEKNLEWLSRVVREERCDVGLAFDGDADRIGMFDEHGRFVDSHKILALLVKYLHEEKGLSGTVVKTFSTSDMLTRMTGAYGLPLETTPIGFKYIAPRILAGDVLVGGEESGGVAVKGHIPERDGIYIGLTVVEMMVKRGRKLSELVTELQDEFGPLFYARDDLHTTLEKKDRFVERLHREGLAEVDGEPVRAVEDLDGIKLRFDDGWLMFRPSGTEPVLRVYAEAPTQGLADRRVAMGSALVG